MDSKLTSQVCLQITFRNVWTSHNSKAVTSRLELELVCKATQPVSGYFSNTLCYTQIYIFMCTYKTHTTHTHKNNSSKDDKGLGKLIKGGRKIQESIHDTQCLDGGMVCLCLHCSPCLGPAAGADGIEQCTGKDSIVFVAHSDSDQLETEAQKRGES